MKYKTLKYLVLCGIFLLGSFLSIDKTYAASSPSQDDVIAIGNRLKGQHFQDLITAINNKLSQPGCSAVTLDWENLVNEIQLDLTIKANHINVIRRNILQAYDANSLPRPNTTILEVAQAGDLILAQHVIDLRDAIQNFSCGGACSCNWTPAATCGTGICSSSTDREETWDCNNPGCQPPPGGVSPKCIINDSTCNCTLGQLGESCNQPNECCSGNCGTSGPSDGLCCNLDNDSCSGNSDCCSGNCNVGTCEPSCIPDNSGICANNAQCCSKNCDVGTATCLPADYSCTTIGVNTGNSSLCPGADVGLTQDTNSIIVDRCSGAKCEWLCNQYMHAEGGAAYCYDNYCVGSFAANSSWCPNTFTNVPVNLTPYEGVASCTSGKCEYYCNVGYALGYMGASAICCVDNGYPCVQNEQCCNNSCTGPAGNKTCGGACSPPNCDDGNPCTADSCDGATGQCAPPVNIPGCCVIDADCPSGQACNGGWCQSCRDCGYNGDCWERGQADCDALAPCYANFAILECVDYFPSNGCSRCQPTGAQCYAAPC